MRFGEFAQLPAEITRFVVCGWTRATGHTCHRYRHNSSLGQ